MPPRLRGNVTYRRTLAVRPKQNQNFNISGLCQRTSKSFSAHPSIRPIAEKHMLLPTHEHISISFLYVTGYIVSILTNKSANHGASD
jgi:hypothetical protein